MASCISCPCRRRPAGGRFRGWSGASGYFFPLLKGTEVIAGLLLLGNRFVPLALTVLAPIVVNIVAFHAFLAPSGIALPLLIVALGVYLAYSERALFAPLLQSQIERTRASEQPTRTRFGGHITAAHGSRGFTGDLEIGRSASVNWGAPL